MEHIEERRLTEHVWDGASLHADERNHLSLCEACRRQLAMLVTLHAELGVAQQSAVRQEAEDRLLAILGESGQFSQHRTVPQRLLGIVTEWIAALPLL